MYPYFRMSSFWIASGYRPRNDVEECGDMLLPNVSTSLFRAIALAMTWRRMET